jgi:hypothetical protein
MGRVEGGGWRGEIERRDEGREAEERRKERDIW